MTKIKKRPSLKKTRAARNGEVVETAKNDAPAKQEPKKEQKADTPAPAESSDDGRRRNLNDLGFVEGSDSAIIAQTLVDGGFDRRDVNERAAKAIEASSGLTNRNGGEKYVPSAVSGVLAQMMKTGGWKIESSWKLVPAE